MHVSPFISGIATGAVAGAVVSMMAAGAMRRVSSAPTMLQRRRERIRTAPPNGVVRTGEIGGGTVSELRGSGRANSTAAFAGWDARKIGW